MANENLDWLYRLRSAIYTYMPQEWLIPMNNALDEAIKKLEQSNSDGDYISRTEALNIINIEGKWIFNNDKVYSPVNVGIALTSIKKKIKELSSIQHKTVCIAQVNFDKDELQKIVDNAMPEIIGSVGPKPGYWINGFCSNCGIYNTSEHKKYCPNCGSKMKTNEHSLDFADQDTLQSPT